jgi:DNA-binding HxlR family transcriptional regulator
MQKDILRSLETLSVLSALRWSAERMSFSELKRSTGLAGATLALRLKVLESEGYVEREVVKSWPPRTLYRVTEKGRELYSQLVEEKLRPEVEEYIERFPREIHSIVMKYLKLKP